MARNSIKRIIELILDPRSARKAERDMQSALQKGTDPGPVRRNLERFGGYVKDVGRHVAAAAASVGAYVLAFTKLGDRGAEVLGVQRAFSAATGDADTAIQKLRKDTNGLIGDYELMVNFNRALSLGAAQNVEDFGEIAAVAVDLGRALGIDATKAMEDLTIGIARGSKLTLDNLGIVVDGAITVDNVMRAARERIDALGGSAGAAGNMVDRFRAQMANLRDEVAKFIANSDTLRVAFFEASNLLETLVLALQSEDFETVKQAFKQVGSQLGALFAASFLEAIALATEKLFPNLTKLPQWVPLLGVFTNIRNLAREAADAGFEAAEAWGVANDALRRQLQAAARLRGLQTPPGTPAGQPGETPDLSLNPFREDMAAEQAARDAAFMRFQERQKFLAGLPKTTGTRTTPVSEITENLETVEDVGSQVMSGLKSVSEELFGSMEEGTEDVGLAWLALAEIMTGSFGGALQRIADMKATEMLALALEEAARGVAALASGNIAGAGAHAAAAAKFGAVAAAWRGVGAVAGGGESGGSPGVGSFGVDAGGAARATDGVEPASPEINIYVDGIDPDNPKHIQLMQRTLVNARAEWGDQRPTVRRYGRSA
jgi:hypothetical protein